MGFVPFVIQNSRWLPPYAKIQPTPWVWYANLRRIFMKRLVSLLALATLLCGSLASAQVPRTVLAELGAATW